MDAAHQPTEDPRSDPGYPQYQGDTEKQGRSRIHQQLHASRRLMNDLPDQVYFVFAGLASIWLAIVALTEAVHHAWWSVLLVLVFWGIAAYITLPRFNLIMTNIYVPSYFFGRTQTSDGVLGDPVNIAVKGEKDDIYAALARAGWTEAEPVTLRSSWKIVLSSLRKTSYPEAPVSPLMLFGKKQDFAFQQEVDGNPSKRHHVRFWKTPEGWKLPGGIEVDYLADGTYDNAVGLSLFTLQITHKVDSDTDKERDYFVETIEHCNPEAHHEVLEDFISGYASRNGGGDEISTDGNLPILDLNEVVPGSNETTDTSPEHQRRHRNLQELASKSPVDVWIAGGLVTLVALVQLGRSLYRLCTTNIVDEFETRDLSGAAAQFTTDTGNDFWTVVTASATAALLVIALVQVILAVGVLRGRHRPRQIILALLCISFVVTAVQIVTDTADASNLYAVFVVMGSHVFAMVAYTSDDVVNYTWASAETRRSGADLRKLRADKKRRDKEEAAANS